MARDLPLDSYGGSLHSLGQIKAHRPSLSTNRLAELNRCSQPSLAYLNESRTMPGQRSSSVQNSAPPGRSRYHSSFPPGVAGSAAVPPDCPAAHATPGHGTSGLGLTALLGTLSRFMRTHQYRLGVTGHTHAATRVHRPAPEAPPRAPLLKYPQAPCTLDHPQGCSSVANSPA